MSEIFGYRFTNESLLREALTTPSFRMQHPTASDNQRLEFLGDAVLGLLSAERLYREFPVDQEGQLTVKRIHMVSSSALCEAAIKFGLREMLLRNRRAEELPPNAKTLADAVEAIIGAAYLDGGLTAARTIFESLNLPANADVPEWSGNPKGELQVRTQALKPRRFPVYTVLSMTGKAHAPVFTVKVEVEGIGEATARAGSRREAEALAAAELLKSTEGARQWNSRHYW